MLDSRAINRVSIRLVQSALYNLKESIFPTSCSICDRSGYSDGQALCKSCRASFELIDHACRRCGAPLHVTQTQTTRRPRCIHCRHGDWPADQIVCLAVYEGVVAKSVIAMKQPNSEALGFYFARLMAERSKNIIPWDNVDLIVPVPQHWTKRIRVRHNAADLLADRLSGHFSKKLVYRGIKRTRKSSKQGMLSRQERAKNVAGIFSICGWTNWQDKTVVVVDDIVTSGSTAAAMCRPIKLAGAKRVIVLAIARGIRNQGVSQSTQRQKLANDPRISVAASISAEK